MIFREARFEDLYSITGMWEKLRIERGYFKKRGDRTGFFVLELLNRLKNPNSIVIVVVDEVDNETPIAFATGSVQNETYSDSKKVFYCDDFYIQPKYRGKGIWHEIIKMGTDKARQYNCSDLGFKVPYGLEKVYERKGFIPEQVLMRKSIETGGNNG